MPQDKLNNIYKEFIQGISEKSMGQAKELKAIERKRKIKGKEDLLNIVMLYCGLDKSLRETAGIYSMQKKEPISDTAIEKRLEKSEGWIKNMICDAISGDGMKDKVTGRRIIIGDGSGIQGPGAKGVDYRLHLGLNLENLEIESVKVTNKYEGEALEKIDLKKGDASVTDRGYTHVKQLEKANVGGADIITRVNSNNTRICDISGEKLNFFEELKAHKKEGKYSREVILESSDETSHLEGVIYAHRIPANKRESARKRCRKRNSKKRRKVKEETLFFSEWVIIFTTIPEKELSRESIFEIYRLRWQIELAFKRMKSLLNLDKLRSRYNGKLANVWILGKLLYILLLDKYSRKKIRVKTKLSEKRGITYWRIYKTTKSLIDAAIIKIKEWSIENMFSYIAIFSERTRKRKLQTLPFEAKKVFNYA